MKIYNAYVCRCEELTEDEIIEAIKQGADTVDAVKKQLRAGMGPCQGKGCRNRIAGLIARHTGKTIEECLAFSQRPPVGVVALKNIVDIELEEDNIV